MRSSYNTPCSKYQLVMSFLYSHNETSLAMSILAIWCRVVQSRNVSLHNFDGLAMSGLAFSVAPLGLVTFGVSTIPAFIQATQAHSAWLSLSNRDGREKGKWMGKGKGREGKGRDRSPPFRNSWIRPCYLLANEYRESN